MLIRKGVKIPMPQTVLIADDVVLDRIAGEGVVIYPGCRIFGEKTLIMPGAKLGHDGPVTVEDCQIGTDVELKGGVFQRSVFLEKVTMGYGAQVRAGCILEEEAKGGHTVGLKQTILFPFVTLGSLINFCDCFMAGGTSRTNHSEVGSSYIHFNYTPNQDKATPTLIGDVPRGVMLNQPPIFLGGQGGIVGPVRVEYGTVIAAGVVHRKDAFGKGKLLLGHAPVNRATMHYPGMYRNVKYRVINNINYIANLMALKQWYIGVRSPFFKTDSMGEMLYAGVLEKLEMALNERIKRFKTLAEKMPESAAEYRKVMKTKADDTILRQKQALFDRWQDLEALFTRYRGYEGDASRREPFLEKIANLIKEKGCNYLPVIRSLDKTWSAKGTKWLQGIVDTINQEAFELLPSYKVK
ncbi:MAG: UDP-N-acetylglucosamine pyrophosphorylase [Deltaproteobacteria bacterium]|nr:UDP-N-acetylglucosamine pyrophosphorylase [Deltaproteobacteria bacterium]RLC11705.1 MAG: UDP-N-acetylglucosamine pyrophosphorylase [Deltaproteobacteria bacterium]